MDLVTKARNFAIEKHHRQMYDKYPYTFHLESVVTILVEAGYKDNEVILASGWLHDVLEDTDTSYHELWLYFSGDIADTVRAVSSNIEGNRVNRLLSVAPGIQHTPNALIVKLADRIANTEYNIVHNSNLHKMYSKEYSLFKSLFYREEDIHLTAMWNRLENCSLNQQSLYKL